MIYEEIELDDLDLDEVSQKIENLIFEFKNTTSNKKKHIINDNYIQLINYYHTKTGMINIFKNKLL